MTKTSILLATASILVGFTFCPAQAQTVNDPGANNVSARDCQSIQQDIKSKYQDAAWFENTSKQMYADMQADWKLAQDYQATMKTEENLWHSAEQAAQATTNPADKQLLQKAASQHHGNYANAKAGYENYKAKAEREEDDAFRFGETARRIRFQEIPDLEQRAKALCAPQNTISQLPQNSAPQLPGGANNNGGLHFPDLGGLGDPLPVDGSGNAINQPNPVVPGTNGGTFKTVAPSPKQRGSAIHAVNPQQTNSVPNFYYASQRQAADGLLMGLRSRVAAPVQRLANPGTTVLVSDPPPASGVGPVTMSVPQMPAVATPVVAMPAVSTPVVSKPVVSMPVNPMPASVQVPCPPTAVPVASTPVTGIKRGVMGGSIIGR